VRDAFAVVHIPDGSDVSIQNGRGIKTDSFGNAIVPTLTAYRHNVISVNTQGETILILKRHLLTSYPPKVLRCQ
jgi:outer membrane usher protein